MNEICDIICLFYLSLCPVVKNEFFIRYVVRIRILNFENKIIFKAFTTSRLNQNVNLPL